MSTTAPSEAKDLAKFGNERWADDAAKLDSKTQAIKVASGADLQIGVFGAALAKHSAVQGDCP